MERKTRLIFFSLPVTVVNDAVGVSVAVIVAKKRD